ncbi:MAG TPA: LysR family transcriptional regulator [Anaerolineae bacterium]|nr:LysR family transcriptional regulator [Anaerolineae bacterium]
MEIRQLEAFVRSARAGSFTAAATQLNLTQPAVSARVAALEKELGGALFERGGRRLRLTRLGQMFLPYAQRALTAVADGREASQRHASGSLGRVTVAALDTLATYMLPEVMERFRAEYPAVDFSIKLRLLPDILAMLHDGRATLGLMGAPLWDKTIHIRAHFQEPVRAVVAANHPLAGKQLSLVDIYEFTIYRITLSPRLTALVENIAEQARSGSGGAVVAIPAIMAAPLLLQGKGIAFLPQGFVQTYVDAGQLVFLEIEDLPLLSHELLVVSLAERPLDPPNTAFVQMLRAQWRHILVN